MICTTLIPGNCFVCTALSILLHLASQMWTAAKLISGCLERSICIVQFVSMEAEKDVNV